MSQRADAEQAREWTRLPPLLNAEVRYPLSERSLLHVRMGLRRDFTAWKEDPAGLNLPLGGGEVDINEPSLGYLHAQGGPFALTVGRFPAHWSPSPEFGLALSDAVPYHNGMEFTFGGARFRYRFLVSSLNPWLEGTPVGDSSSEDYPPGSEEYRQRHYPSGRGASVFHNRVYADRAKTLFGHRVEGAVGPLALGITEIQVIGGKAPDLRDAGPFVTFHNDFKEGFANGAVSIDAALRLPWGARLTAECLVDDVQYPGTEGSGNTPSLQGYLAGLAHAFMAGDWLISHSLHAARTDPFLYGYLQPLNTLASRHVLATNNQEPSDPVFTDKVVVDYPVGYLRGGDAFDFWYRLEAWNGKRTRLGATAAVLAKGEIDLYDPYERHYDWGHGSPSGVAERETRLGLDVRHAYSSGWVATAGVAWNSIRDGGHVPGRDRHRFFAACGLARTWPGIKASP